MPKLRKSVIQTGGEGCRDWEGARLAALTGLVGLQLRFVLVEPGLESSGGAVDGSGMIGGRPTEEPGG